MSGDSSASGTSTTSGPAWLEPYMQSYVGQAANLASQQQPMYMGQRVAPLNQQFTTANDLITQMATNSSPDVLAGRGAITNIAGGAYQNNPWLSPNYTNQVIGQQANQMADAFSRGTAAQNDAMFAQQGAYGGSAYQQKQAYDAAELAKQVGAMSSQYNLANQQLGANDYRAGINQMAGAAGMAPALQGMDLQAAQALAGAGDIQRNYLQQLLDTGYNTWQGQQQYPYQQMQFFGNALGIPGGGTTTTSQTQPGASPWTTIGGLGLLGLGLMG